MDIWELIFGTKVSPGQRLISLLPSSTKNMTRVNSKVMDLLEVVVLPKTVILFEGGFAEIFPDVSKDKQVFSFLCPAARLHDPAEGFLEKRCFLVRAEIRLKLQDNERWTVSVKRKTATCTVRSTSPSKHVNVCHLQWKLKGLPSLCPTRLRSAFFNIRETEWCNDIIWLCPCRVACASAVAGGWNLCQRETHRTLTTSVYTSSIVRITLSA